ncbi:MAG: hypothetical protein QOJ89_492 [bacterium]
MRAAGGRRAAVAVLSIGALAHGQQDYYERQVAQGHDDYYSGRGEAPGEWAGRGAGALGLSGRVQAEQFNALIAGVNPVDPQLQESLRDRPVQLRVAAYDLTFSAPKSVSVLFAAADEQTSRDLIEAHEAAVTGALSYVEDEAVKVRRGHGGSDVQGGGGLVAAAYRHRMSRALDPQLHTHVVAANIAQGPDGRWTGLWGTPLYEHAQTAGYLYQAHLRAEVRDRLGLEWGPVVRGAAELVAVSEDVRRAFSQRRAEILAREAELEAQTGRRLGDGGRERVAHATRERKQYGVETHTWREEVCARASELGLGAPEIAAALERGRERLAPGVGGEKRVVRGLGDRLAGAHGRTERVNAFAAREVLREYAAAAGQGARVDEVRSDGERFAARGDVLQTAAGELTTADLVGAERRLISAAIARVGEGTAIVPADVLEHALGASDRPLSDQQAAAVRAVATSGNGVDVVEALAGTGKTFTAGTIRRVYEGAGYSVIGMGPTGRAVRELAEEAGVAASTIDRALLDLERFDEGFAPRTVVILDEAGMAGTRTTERVLAHAQHAGAKVIAIGDSGQLASVQAGGWLRAVGERVGALELTEVMRQRDRAERRALGQLHAGQPGNYLAWADEHDRLQVHTASDAHGGALADWQAAVGKHGIAGAVLIARDQATRGALNRAARKQRGEQGALGLDRAYGPVVVAVGDRVICRRNDRRVDVDNGTRGTVRATLDDAVVIETDAGTVRELPAGYVAEHVEHAYCLTGHGMQGGTVEHATVLAGVRDLTKGWSYTALSRARGATRLHVDVASVTAAALEREEHAPTVEREPQDRAQVLARVVARMLIRDDEDLAISQLPAAPAAGRPDDRELHATPSLAAGELQELGAELAEPVAPAASAARLADLRREVEALRAQRASLPMRELRELDAIAGERARLAGQRDDAAIRLAAVPGPERRLLGRGNDAHAAERARLSAAVGSADQQLAALEQQAARLERELGPAGAVRDERDGRERRIGAVEHDARLMRDELAERDVARPPAWARELFGERPGQYRRAEYYDRGVREVARYRVEFEISEQMPGLGPEPADGDARSAWRGAQRIAEQTQRRLGRDVTRGHALGHDR